MPSLGQLPPELPDMIMGCFCQHCTLLEYDCDDPYPWHKEHWKFCNERDAAFAARTTLADISLTSKWLNVVANAAPLSPPSMLRMDDTFDALLKDGVFPSAPEIARHFDTSRLARMTLGEDDIPDHPPIREAWDFSSWETTESLDMLVSLCPSVEIGQNLNRYSIDVDMLARIAAVAPHITCLVCFYFDGQQSHNPKRWRSRPPSPDMVGGPSSSIPEARRLESFTFVHLAELKLWVSNRKPEALARLLGA
ncbi:hypothetical protein VTI28DRAFT_8441 [Corynascus sepedonium]